MLDFRCDYGSPSCVWHTGKAHHSKVIKSLGPRQRQGLLSTIFNQPVRIQKSPGRVSSTNVLRALRITEHTPAEVENDLPRMSKAQRILIEASLDFSTTGKKKNKKTGFFFLFSNSPTSLTASDRKVSVHVDVSSRLDDNR